MTMLIMPMFLAQYISLIVDNINAKEGRYGLRNACGCFHGNGSVKNAIVPQKAHQILPGQNLSRGLRSKEFIISKLDKNKKPKVQVAKR
ncbi:MAG: hypothetical protein LKI65_02220 [Prevotella sp.]|nr:hypothetical protein [Prevotella sp.]MCI1802156.1 hypothetical protein [Prevotella sp.]MCI1817359.1 hypothetical protein [Prevotella sp.]